MNRGDVVFALDRRKRPLMPTTPKRAGQLLSKGRERVHKRNPYTIRIVDFDARNLDLDGLLALKLDPGTGFTGVALVRLAPSGEAKLESGPAPAGPGGDVVQSVLAIMTEIPPIFMNIHEPPCQKPFNKRNSEWQKECNYFFSSSGTLKVNDGKGDEPFYFSGLPRTLVV